MEVTRDQDHPHVDRVKKGKEDETQIAFFMKYDT